MKEIGLMMKMLRVQLMFLCSSVERWIHQSSKVTIRRTGTLDENIKENVEDNSFIFYRTARKTGVSMYIEVWFLNELPVFFNPQTTQLFVLAT